MAKSPFSTRNVHQARQYLNELQREYPNLRGRVPPSEMNPETVVRLANSYYRQLQEGLTPSKKEAHGHGTDPEYDKARASEQPPSGVTERRFQSGNYSLDNITMKNARATLNMIGRRGHAIHAIVVNTKAGHKTLVIGQAELQKRLNRGETFSGIINKLLEQKYGREGIRIRGSTISFFVVA